MKLIGFAIASIVDASTGSGLARSQRDTRFAANTATDTASKASTSTARDTHFVAALFRPLTRLAGAIYHGLKGQARQRRDIRQLAELSDRQLRDIGLHRGDIDALSLGRLSFDELEQARRLRVVQARQPVSRLAVKRLDLPRIAANDVADGQPRCA